MFCTCYFEAGDSDQRKKTACFVTKIEPMLAYRLVYKKTEWTGGRLFVTLASL